MLVKTRAHAQVAMLLAVLFCGGVGACSPGDRAEMGAANRGAEIAPILIDSTVIIGGSEGEGPAAFRIIRDVTLLDNPPRVAVVDWDSQEMRFFSLDGEPLDVLGGRGAGPGEYTGLANVRGFPGGRVVAWDQVQRRITMYFPEGPQTIRPDLTPFHSREPVFVGILSDTSFVFRFPVHAGSLEGRAPGPFVDTVPFVRFDRNGGTLDTVAAVTAPEQRLFASGPLWGLERIIFGSTLHASVVDGILVVGSGESGELSLYGPEASSALRTGLARRMVSPELVAAERQHRILQSRTARFRVDGAGDLFERHRTVIERLPAAKSAPAFDGIATGPDGSVWLQQPVLPSDSVVQWVRMELNGDTRESLALPVDEQLESGTAEYAVVRGLDEMRTPMLKVLFFGPER